MKRFMLGVVLLALLVCGVQAADKPAWSNRYPFGGYTATTMTGNATLTSGGSTAVQRLNPNGSNRTVTLPAEADSLGLYYFVFHSGTANTIAVQDDTPVTVKTLSAGQCGFFTCNGTAWTGVVMDGPSAAALSILDTGGDHTITISAGSDEAADRAVTLPALGAAAVLVTEAGTQTLTNKTMTNPTLNAGSGVVVAPAATSPAQTAEGSVVWDSDDDLLTVGDGSARKTMVSTAATQTLTNKTLTTPTLTAPAFGSSPTGDGVTQWVEVALTAAEVKALRATPKTLVAAPGAGKYAEFVSAQLFLDYGTTQFAEDGGGSNLGVRYTNGSGVQVSEDIEMTGYITQAGDYSTNTQAKKDAIVAKAGCENQALVLHNIGAGEIVTGDSTMRVKVAYRVWTTGW